MKSGSVQRACARKRTSSKDGYAISREGDSGLISEHVLRDVGEHDSVTIEYCRCSSCFQSKSLTGRDVRNPATQHSAQVTTELRCSGVSDWCQPNGSRPDGVLTGTTCFPDMYYVLGGDSPHAVMPNVWYPLLQGTIMHPNEHLGAAMGWVTEDEPNTGARLLYETYVYMKLITIRCI
ncbi:hypothetical protein DEU56DRAFT_752382 [Suillus clintonianus]|uniref:uncharacterized protein n=1 Tax=Suillus clintonianus TaxID=1904413 RepID=UPI001B86FF43|nr:uncharacterized protein DEU56DRAFT_752382 [Suillus clintonianus]KAG2151486.1 hypothetical protein DEU56DRAFT_752382 [Suillus clintonianus]